MDFHTINDVNGDVMHAFTFAQQTKPLSAQQVLFNALTPVSQPFFIAAGETYQFSPDRENAGIVLLSTGIGSVCHKENHLYISSAFAPTVLGLIDGYSLYYNVPARPQHYFYAETDCEGYFVPLNKFVEIADEQNLWHDVARILAHRLIVMSAREQELVGVDSYLKVRSLILELWTYPEEYRKGINVVSFIQRRTGLSRSRTMTFLSELRKGGYITIVRGKLTSVDQKLPVAY